MKYFYQTILIIAAILLFAQFADATSVLSVFGGGTGSTTPSGILVGQNSTSIPLRTLLIGTGLSFNGTTLSASGGGSTGLATSAPISNSNVLVYSSAGAGTAYGSATSTLAFSGPFNGVSGLGFLIGGSNSTVTWDGLATTSQPSSSNLLVSNGGAGVYGVATTTLSGSGLISVTAGATTLGGSPITVSCSTCGTGSVTSVATNNGLTGGTITTTGTIGLASIAAGVLGTPVSAVPTSQATSTLYGAASTGGFVLQWSNSTNGLVLAATSTSAGGGSTVTVAATTSIAGIGSSYNLFLKTPSISVVSGDTVNWWVNGFMNGANCNSGDVLIQAGLKQSTMAATTTQNQVDFQLGGAHPCGLSTWGTYTATTTETVNVSADAVTPGVSFDSVSLMAEKIH